MTEPTISLRELREWATDPNAYPKGHASTVLALVEAVEADLGPRGDGRFHMTSGELRCPECHDPSSWHHVSDCRRGAALARFSEETRP